MEKIVEIAKSKKKAKSIQKKINKSRWQNFSTAFYGHPGTLHVNES